MKAETKSTRYENTCNLCSHIISWNMFLCLLQSRCIASEKHAPLSGTQQQTFYTNAQSLHRSIQHLSCNTQVMRDYFHTPPFLFYTNILQKCEKMFCQFCCFRHQVNGSDGDFQVTVIKSLLSIYSSSLHMSSLYIQAHGFRLKSIRDRMEAKLTYTKVFNC
jgi:hypothetical protein